MLSNILDCRFITVIRFLNEWNISGEQLHSGTVTLRNTSLTKAINLLRRAAGAGLRTHSSRSFSSPCERGLGLSPGGSSVWTFCRRPKDRYYEANVLRTLPCSAVSRCAAGESLGFIAADCVNQNEHQQIFRLLSWQLISTEPKRLSWRYICPGVHDCIADIRNLLILVVEDDAIVPGNCCCSGLKHKYLLMCHAIALQKLKVLIISCHQSQEGILWVGFFLSSSWGLN